MPRKLLSALLSIGMLAGSGCSSECSDDRCIRPVLLLLVKDGATSTPLRKALVAVWSGGPAGTSQTVTQELCGGPAVPECTHELRDVPDRHAVAGSGSFTPDSVIDLWIEASGSGCWVVPRVGKGTVAVAPAGTPTVVAATL